MLSPSPHGRASERIPAAGQPQEVSLAHPPENREEYSAKGASTGLVIEQVNGDLLEQKVDVIVNAWNRNLIPYWLLLTQGVSGAIKRQGGTGPFKELRSMGVLPIGAARLTSAGALPFKGIIHVAGINHAWRSSEASVRMSATNALRIAQDRGFESIAFPAIGAGSSITFGSRQLPVWGISQQRSLGIIAEQARLSGFQGKVVIVEYTKPHVAK